MAGSGVLLTSLGNGTIISGTGTPLNGHSIFVYQTGTTNQVQVYSDLALTQPLAQPLITGSNGYAPGQIPGFIAGEQAVDFFDSYANIRMQANPVAAADLAAAGIGSSGLPSSVVNTAGSSSGQVPIASGGGAYAWGPQTGGGGSSGNVTSANQPLTITGTPSAGQFLSATGSQFAHWVTSSPGATGPAGPSGPMGATGSQGAQGVQGVMGATGATGAAGSPLVEAALQSSSFAASAGTFYPVDISTANVTATLPTAPPDQTQITFKVINVAATPGTYSLTLQCGGSDVFNNAGGSATGVLSAKRVSTVLQYAHATGIWYQLSGDASTGQALGAAKLGNDGTVGGPQGSPLNALVVQSVNDPLTITGVPTSGQVLTATGSSGAHWATASGGGTATSISTGSFFSGGSTGSLVVTDFYGDLQSSRGANGQNVAFSGPSNAVVWQTPSSHDPRVEYGAKGDLRQITDGAMSFNGSVLSSAAQYTFTAADVGKQVMVYNGQAANAYTGGVPLITSISSVTGGNATLALPCVNASGVSGATVLFGTDDTTALQNALTALGATYAATGVRQTLTLGDADYLVTNNNATGSGGGGQYVYAALIAPSGVLLAGTGLQRLVTFPIAATQTTGSYTLTHTSSVTIPVLSTAGFINLGGFGQQLVLPDSSIVEWASLDATNFYGCGVVSGPTTYVGSAGDTFLFRKATTHITPTLAGATNFAVRSLVLDGQSFAPIETGDNTGIVAGQGGAGTFTDWDITDCEFRHFYGKCIELAAAANTRFRIQRCNIHDSSSNAISLDQTQTDFAITDNFIHDINAAGAESIVGGAGNVRGLIARNIIENWGTVDLAGTDVALVDNIFRSSGVGTGPLIGMDTANTTRCKIVGNTIDQSQLPSSIACIYGSYLHTDLIVSGNHFRLQNAAGYAVQLTNAGNTISFTGNIIDGPGGTAYYFTNLTGTNITATGNQLNGLINGSGGMAVTASARGVVNSNIVNGGNLRLIAASGGTLNGNHVVNSGSGGQTLTFQGAGITVTGNTISYGSNSAGAILATSATGCNVVGNTIIYTPASGICVAYQESSSDYNTFAFNRYYAPNGGAFGSPIARGSLGTHSVCTANYSETWDTPLDAPSSQPAVAASGSAYTNYLKTNCMVYVTGGTVSAIAINGLSTGLTAGVFPMKVGHTITLTYTAAPTWVWFGS